jgi:hypothetical protein
MSGYYEREDRPVPIAGVIVVALLAAVVSIGLTFGDKTLLHDLGAGQWASVLGKLAGHAMIVVLPTWIALYLLFYRRREGGGITMVVVLLAILGVNAGGLVLLDWALKSPWTTDRAQRNIAYAQIDAAKAALLAGRPIDMHIKAKGQFGEMERISKQMFNELDADRRQYKATLAASGYPGFLKPQQYKSDRGLVQTRAKLARVRQALALYRHQLASLVDDGRAMVMASRMSDTAKAEMIKGMERSRTQNAQNDQVLALDDAIFAQRAAMLDVLAHAKGRWVVSGDQLKFYNASDLAAYRADVARLQDLAAQERKELTAVQAHAASLPDLASHEGD